MNVSRSLGSMVVRLAVELAKYKADWNEAAAVTKDGAAQVEAATAGATDGLGKLTDAASKLPGELGNTASKAGQLLTALQGIPGVAIAVGAGLAAVAAATGAVAYAAIQGDKEQRKLNDTLILTGNYAGLLTGQLDKMAASVANNIGGTVSASRQILASLAATGRFTVDAMGEVATAVQLVARFSGQTNEQVLKDFAGMANGVAKWAEKTNESYHFLDLATYRYIKSLEEQGDKQAAMRVTSEALSKHLGGELTQNLGYLDRVLNEVTGTWSRFWAAAKDLGKSTPLEKQIDALSASIEKAKAGWSAGSLRSQAAIAAQQDELRTLLRRKEIIDGNTAAQTASAQATEKAMKADDEWGKIVDRNRDRQERMNKELREARAAAAAAGKSAIELAKVEAEIRDRYKEKKPKGKTDEEKELERQRKLLAELSGVQADYMQQLTDLNKLRESGNIGEARYIELVTALIAKQPMAKALMDEQAKAVERLAKATAAAAMAHESHLKTLGDGVAKLQEQIDKQKEHNAALGQSKTAVAELEAAKLEEQATAVEGLAIRKMEKDLDEGMYELYMKQAAKLRELAQLKRAGGVKEDELDRMKAAAKETERSWESIDRTAHDVFVNMEDGATATWERIAKSLKATVYDLLYQLTVRQWLINLGFAGPGGVGAGGGVGGGANNLLGMYNSASNLNTIYGAAAQYFTGGTAGASGASLAYANGVGMVGGDSIGALYTANGGWAGVSAGGASGASGAAAAGGSASTSGVLAAAAPYIAIAAIAIYGAYENTRGETRSGAQYGYSFDGASAYNPRRGTSVAARGVGATLLEGPTGGDPDADNNRNAINSTVTSINAALRVLGIDNALTGYQAAYESSERSRGGVFSGGTLRNGARFGEPGTGTNVDARGPHDSLYEQWGPNGMALDNGGNADLDGSVADLMTDMQQSYIEAIQASVGLLPRIVEEHFTEMVSQAMGDQSPELNQINHTRYLRVYDEAARESIRTLGLLPRRIADLVLDVDPETLSAEATQALTTQISTLIANVGAFHDIVDALPVTRFRDLAFDVAAGLVEMSGGIERFAANISSYVENFYSDAEKRDHVARNIVSTVNAAGGNLTAEQVLSMSRPQYREMLERAQQDTSESGQRLVATLLAMNSAFASITPLADAAGDAIAAQREGLELQLLRLQGNTAEIRSREWAALNDGPSRSLQEQIWAIEDASARQASMASEMDAAMAAVERAVDARRRIAEAAAADAQELVQSLQSVFDTLKSNVRALYNEVDSTREISAAEGEAFIAIALARARAGGGMPDAGALSDAIDSARGGFEGRTYAKQADRDFDRLVLAGQLKELESLAGPQLTAAQQAAQLAQDQVDYLDKLLEQARNNLDAVNGVDTSVVSVEEAIGKLYDAFLKANPAARQLAADGRAAGAAAAGNAASAAGPGFVIGGGVNVNGAYSAGYTGAYVRPEVGILAFARTLPFGTNDQSAWQSLRDKAAISGWSMALVGQALGFSEDQIRNAMQVNGLPAFAAGGDHAGGWMKVGERGTELVYSPPARIFNATDTEKILGGGTNGSAEMVAELRALRGAFAEMRTELAQIKEASKQSARYLKGSTRGGGPVTLTEAV